MCVLGGWGDGGSSNRLIRNLGELLLDENIEIKKNILFENKFCFLWTQELEFCGA